MYDVVARESGAAMKRRSIVYVSRVEKSTCVSEKYEKRLLEFGPHYVWVRISE